MDDPFDLAEADSSREAFRAKAVEAIPSSYNPWLHLATPSLVGLSTIALSLWSLENVSPLQWLTVPIVFIASNATEWRVHKSLLHKRTRGFELLYDRHTPMHHRVFRTEDMAIRSPKEFALVLLPWFGIVLILIATLPLATLFVLLGMRNVAALFLATAMGYVVSYEWLHLAYHLPLSHPISQWWFIAALRSLHATHHDPALMRKWNFNVSIPLWDLVRGTWYRR